VYSGEYTINMLEKKRQKFCCNPCLRLLWEYVEILNIQVSNPGGARIVVP
jgi:hypothetical protein